MTELDRVNLTGTRTTIERVKKLREALPGCVIDR
jgi:hypothetical protein